eukprot:COSAG01_NODE_12162_length_1790_cov_1.615021_2_plen_168_part_00
MAAIEAAVSERADAHAARPRPASSLSSQLTPTVATAWTTACSPSQTAAAPPPPEEGELEREESLRRKLMEMKLSEVRRKLIEVRETPPQAARPSRPRPTPRRTTRAACMHRRPVHAGLGMAIVNLGVRTSCHSLEHRENGMRRTAAVATVPSMWRVAGDGRFRAPGR